MRSAAVGSGGGGAKEAGARPLAAASGGGGGSRSAELAPARIWVFSGAVGRRGEGGRGGGAA